jgi:hypothetical protein
MNGGLILCTKCGSKELLEINDSNDEHSSFLFQICPHGFGGKDVPCTKRIVVLYEKSFISLSMVPKLHP